MKKISLLLTLTMVVFGLVSCATECGQNEPQGPVTASYKVQYYFQNIADDEYTLDETKTQTLEGKSGEKTTAEATTFTGFTACAFDQQKIAEDGKTVVKINYDRNKYKITFDTDGGSQMDPVSLKYEATIPAPAEPTKTGFTFYHWDKEIPAKMPAEDLSIKAQWCIRTSVADLATALSVATDDNEVYNIVITDKNIDDFLMMDLDAFYDLPLPSKYAFDLSECTETTVIPDNKFNRGIFFENPSLFGIILPSSITILGGYNFYNCGNLISVKLNENLETIGYRVFQGCSKLEDIIIPSTVQTISNHVFAECSNLKSIVIPAGVETIGQKAFQNCTNLTDITISEGVKNIKDLAFELCSLETLTIPTSIEFIDEGSFNWNKLKEVVIPAGVKSIGSYAFGYNPLTKLTFEDPTGWYKTKDYDSWLAKTGGEAVDVSDPAVNAAKFVTSSDNGYIEYYFYKK